MDNFVYGACYIPTHVCTSDNGTTWSWLGLFHLLIEYIALIAIFVNWESMHLERSNSHHVRHERYSCTSYSRASFLHFSYSENLSHKMRVQIFLNRTRVFEAIYHKPNLNIWIEATYSFSASTFNRLIIYCLNFIFRRYDSETREHITLLIHEKGTQIIVKLESWN